ncbi:MAG TPA: lamin tail domain-containing protein, partial [Oceanipulchritudo sp.]|nr:lamin tail domain-containing protein [Oceanipulchritudo sp.]
MTGAERAVSTDRDDYEFLELHNLADRSLDLSGVTFSDGITFTFPDHFLLGAGERAVIVRDAAAFSARYGDDLSIAGVYSGRLSNGGERLALSLAGSGLLRELSYHDASPWPVLSDGDGYSLVRREQVLDSDHALPASWAPHQSIGGAPGAADE